MRQTLSWIWDKLVHHWWPGSGTDLPGWSTCSNTIKQIGENLLSKESGYEFKNLAWKYGTCQLWAQALSWWPAPRAFAQVSVWILHSTFIGSSTHWIYKISVSSIFQRRQVLQHFTDMIFSWPHPDTYLDHDRIWERGQSLSMAITLSSFWEVGPPILSHGFKEGANSLIVFETEGALLRDTSTCSTTYVQRSKGENLWLL